MRGEPWTAAQRSVLEEFGYLGVERVVILLRRHFGVSRTPKAVQCEAQRLGISLYRYETCPVCGRAFKALDPKTGFCRKCHLQNLKATNEERYRSIRKQIAENEKENRDEAQQLQRDINALRSKNYRARKQLQMCADYEVNE